MKDFFIIKEKKKIKKKRLFIFQIDFSNLKFNKNPWGKFKKRYYPLWGNFPFPLADFRYQNYPNVCSIELYLQ